MKKLTLLLISALLFLSGCQSNSGSAQGISLIPAPTAQPSVLTSSPIPSPAPALSLTPTESGVLWDGILYRPVVVEGIIEISQKEGEGVSLDLNGDGIAEYLYTHKEGIFINGIKQTTDYNWDFVEQPEYAEAHQLWETYWITDVDTADSYYNLIFQFSAASSGMESLTYYDGALKQIATQDLFYDGSGFSKAEYHGDGTYLMAGSLWDFMGQQYPTDIEYRLVKDETTGDIKEKRITEFMPLKEPWPLELLDSITMYTKPDSNAESFLAKAQPIFVTAASDNWVQVLLEDHMTEAWIYVECVWDKENRYVVHVIDQGKNVREIFSGFSDAG